LSTLIFKYSNASSSQFLHYRGLLLYMSGAHPIKLIATWLAPDRSITGKSQKRIER